MLSEKSRGGYQSLCNDVLKLHIPNTFFPIDPYHASNDERKNEEDSNEDSKNCEAEDNGPQHFTYKI